MNEETSARIDALVEMLVLLSLVQLYCLNDCETERYLDNAAWSDGDKSYKTAILTAIYRKENN